MSCVVCSWVFRLSPFQSSSSPQQQRSHSLLLAAANKTKPSFSSSLLIYSLSSTVCTFQRLRLLLTSVERRAGSMCAFLPVASLLHAADKHPEKSQRIEEESGRPLRYRKPLFYVQEKNPVLLWRVIDSSVHEFGLGFTSLLVDSWNFVVVVATDLLRSSQRKHVGHGVLSLLLALALTSKNAPPSSMETFENVPQTLSGADKAHRIQRPKSAKAESCTRKCVSTCIRGGAGAPGEGPLNVRRPLVVFKEGFRSRQYCISIAPTLSQMQMDEKSLRLFFRVPKKLKLEHWPVKSDFTLCYSRMCDTPILQIGSAIPASLSLSCFALTNLQAP